MQPGCFVYGNFTKRFCKQLQSLRHGSHERLLCLTAQGKENGSQEEPHVGSVDTEIGAGRRRDGRQEGFKASELQEAMMRARLLEKGWEVILLGHNFMFYSSCQRYVFVLNVSNNYNTSLI